MATNNINLVALTGNLTKDPELRETGSGTSVCELRIATNTPVKTDSGWDSKANYFQVTAWGGLGENCAKYLAKGSPVAVQGRLEWQSWEAADGGGTNSRTVIIANTIQFLGGPSKEKAKTSEEGSTDNEGDDIPF